MKKEIIKYLDYNIELTCDGYVLCKPKGKLYEYNLGNYTNNAGGLEACKKAAVIHYMLARPEIFSACLRNRILRGNHSGTMGEYYLLKDQVLKEKLVLPLDITPSIDMNALILFNNKPLKW